MPLLPGLGRESLLGTCPGEVRSHGPSSLPSGSSFSSSPSWWVCTKPRGLGLGCELMKEEVGSLVPWQR